MGESVRMTDKKMGRNEPCFCGSGKKFKKCCLLSPENLVFDRVLSPHTLQDNGVNNSPEYNALEEWVDEYLNHIENNHPLRECLMDVNVRHSTILEIAKQNGCSDYYVKAEKLYAAYLGSKAGK